MNFLTTNKTKTTFILLTGFILFLSTALAVIAWYIAPVLLPEVQKARSSSNNPPLTSIVFGEADLNEAVSLKNLNVKVWTDPAKITPGQEAQLFLEILDNSGNPVPLDTSIHYTRIHTYAVRDDLGGNTLHLHPTETENGSGIWKTFINFPSGGTWYLVNQNSKDGTVYQITTTLNIDSESDENFTPDFSQRKELDRWMVNIQLDKEIIKVGEPVKFAFNVVQKPGEEPPKLEGSILDNGHNFIIVKRGDSFVWNQHGDSSVEKVSEQTALPVKRVPKDEHPLSHIVTFPEPGVWLLHFELQSKPVHFFVEVV